MRLFLPVVLMPPHKLCVNHTGQFSREPEVSVYDVHEGVDPLKKEATMEVKGNKLLVTRYTLTRT